MPLDPADLRWLESRLDTLDTDVGDLLVATQKLVLLHRDAAQQIKVADGRNKALWALATTLALGIIFGTTSHFYWGGSVDTTLKSQSRQIDDLQASVRALTKEVQEHERRASTPKPEPVK